MILPETLGMNFTLLPLTLAGKLHISEGETDGSRCQARRESVAHSKQPNLHRLEGAFPKWSGGDLSSFLSSIAAMTLLSLPADKVNWTEFGSMLFLKSVSGTRWVQWNMGSHWWCGLLIMCRWKQPTSSHQTVHFLKTYSLTRVVAPGAEKAIGPHTFTSWGAHYNGYPCAYITAAAAIGMRKEEVDTFVKRLDKAFSKFKRKCSQKTIERPLESAGTDTHGEQGVCVCVNAQEYFSLFTGNTVREDYVKNLYINAFSASVLVHLRVLVPLSGLRPITKEVPTQLRSCVRHCIHFLACSC